MSLLIVTAYCAIGFAVLIMVMSAVLLAYQTRDIISVLARLTTGWNGQRGDK